MFADAEHDRHPQDGRILVGFDFERDIDIESLHQYRQTLASLQPSHPWVGISDMDFLKKLGALRNMKPEKRDLRWQVF